MLVLAEENAAAALQKKALVSRLGLFFCNGGEGGIRTLEQFNPLHAFQACSFSHSDTSPKSFFVRFLDGFTSVRITRLRARYRPRGAFSGNASESATRTPHQNLYLKPLWSWF